MQKKEGLLMAASVGGTLLLALVLVRWFAPQLLGVPVDLQLVKVGKEVPPFFDNIFQKDVLEQKKFTIPDPYIMRGKPLLPTVNLAMGPNDILGFRNRQVPNIADIVTIGDSQTYGNNAPLEMSWPSRLAAALSDKTNTLYNMSVGGWGAAQYADIFDKAVYLQPLVVVVAYYTGNDPLDSFAQVYGNERWRAWRPNSTITAADAPGVPDKQSDLWQVMFSDGFVTKFTPAYRYISNEYENPVVRAGYDIMVRSAEEIAAKAKLHNIKIIFTVIPTKEYVYAKKILSENITPRGVYPSLIQDEQKNINNLADRLGSIPGAIYVDLPSRLQSEVLRTPNLYPMSDNGHPSDFGYEVIARTLAPHVRQFLPIKPSGLVVNDTGQQKIYYIIHNSELWLFTSEKILAGNGWEAGRAVPISQRFIDNLPIAAIIRTKDPDLYGPDSAIFK